MTTNYARFKINGTASSTRGIDMGNGTSVTFTLEAVSGIERKVEYWVYSATDEDSPLASKSAPALVLSNGVTTGHRVAAATPGGNVTTTTPGSGVHSWIVRCLVNDGVNHDGSVNPDYVFERMISIRSSGGRRKIVASEGTQYEASGWAGAQNDDVDGGDLIVGTAYQHLEWSTSWLPVDDLTLPGGYARWITLPTIPSGTAYAITLKGQENTAGTGGDARLQAGAGGVANGSAYVLDGAQNPVIQVQGVSKLGFFGVTPVVRPGVVPSSCTAQDIANALIDLGLLDELVA